MACGKDSLCSPHRKRKFAAPLPTAWSNGNGAGSKYVAKTGLPPVDLGFGHSVSRALFRVQEACQHMALMILSAEKDSEHPHLLSALIDHKIEHRTVLRDGAQTWSQVWPKRTLKWRFRQCFNLIVSAAQPIRCALDGALQRITERGVAVDEMVKNEAKIVNGLAGPNDPIGHVLFSSQRSGLRSAGARLPWIRTGH